VRNKVNYTYNKKVYINHNLQKIQHQPIGDGSEIFLPETEICKSLDIKINANTKGTTQNDIKYISLDEINRYYTKAVYDSEKSAVILSPVVDSSKNILKDYSFASRYNPYSNPGATLKPYVDNGEVVLRCVVTSNIYNQGLYTVVTDELEKYGAGEYTISFEAKSYNGNKTTVQVRPHYVRYEGFSLIEKEPKKSVTVNGQWQRYEVTFDISDWDLSVDASAIIRICSDNTPGYDVLFKNIAMTKNISESTPTNTPTNTPTPSTLPEDINGDHAINMSDVILVAKCFNTVLGDSKYDAKCDIDKDGTVNMKDVIFIAKKFNTIY